MGVPGEWKKHEFCGLESILSKAPKTRFSSQGYVPRGLWEMLTTPTAEGIPQIDFKTKANRFQD